MQSSVLSLLRVRVLAVVLAILGAGAAFLLMTSSAYAAAPTGFTSQTYMDTDANGTIDRAVVVINGGVALTACTVTDVEVGTDWTYVGGATFGGSLTSAGNQHSCVTGTATATFVIQSATAGVTGGGTAPTIAYDNDDADNSIANAAGNLGTVAAQNLSDGAAPQMKTFTYADNDADGKIDRFTVAFTESVAGTSNLEAGHLSLTGVGDFTGAAFGADTTDLITGAVSSVVVPLGTEASAVDTLDGTGTLAISSIFGDGNMLLTDGTNNNTSVKAQSQATFVDGARPVLVTSSPANLATSVSRSASIVLTFSETVTGVTWTMVGGPITSAFTASGTSTVTLAHADLFSSGYHQVTVTAAPDATGNLFNGAVPAISNPFSFTVISSSSATSSTETSTEPTYEIDVTSPNGGEVLVPGAMETITWEGSSSSGSMGFVNINLSYTENGSTVQTTIVSATENDGSYNWTVPNVDTDSATIQIVGTDLVEALATDSSDAEFTIGATTVTDETGDDSTGSDTSGTGVSPVTGEVEDISSVSCGDYIRSNYFSTVYYLDCASGDMVRRPFLDAQTFKTWQSNWNGVDTVTDATLPTITLGSPMLPKAGVVLVKIQSDARVFAIEGDGTIRWITSESVAIANFGTNWADYVIDVSATLFPRFTQGDDLDTDEDGDTGIMKTRATVNS